MVETIDTNQHPEPSQVTQNPPKPMQQKSKPAAGEVDPDFKPTSTIIIRDKPRDNRADHLKMLVNDALRELLNGQSHMDIIHMPRLFTRL